MSSCHLTRITRNLEMCEDILENEEINKTSMERAISIMKTIRRDLEDGSYDDINVRTLKDLQLHLNSLYLENLSDKHKNKMFKSIHLADKEITSMLMKRKPSISSKKYISEERLNKLKADYGHIIPEINDIGIEVKD